MEHESEASTTFHSTTEQESHTSTTARTRTDGVEVGDEISYELVYDHRVQPETLMALPEDQMLAPHSSHPPRRSPPRCPTTSEPGRRPSARAERGSFSRSG